MVGLFSTIIALAMAEIASAFPTAGGLYYWASKLGSPGWGWATGWFNLIGQIAVTAAIGYGLATFGTALFDYWFGYSAHMKTGSALGEHVDLRPLRDLPARGRDHQHLPGQRHGDAEHGLGLLAHGRGRVHRDHPVHRPGRPPGARLRLRRDGQLSGYGDADRQLLEPCVLVRFGLGLLLSQYTITGFDASAHMAEETHQASRQVAVGMYMSVVASVVFGWILLLAVTFAMPSTEGALENIGVVVPWIWAESMSQTWAEALLFICVVAQFFCVTASVTSASRMMFAFSRDRAVPGHPLWRKVATNRVPRNAVWAIVVLAGMLMIPAIWNYLVGYGVGTAIAVIGLYIAFVIPVYLRFRMHDEFVPGAWSLGRHYKWIDLLSLAWVALITILFIFPLYKAGAPVGGRLHVGADELHGAVVRGDRSRLRRLVVHLREELVQGPGPAGHGGGARAARAEARGSPPVHAARARGLDIGPGRGAPLGAPSRRHPVQAPPFWSIACPVTPRASGESS